jgi:hypothetical protein
MRSGRDKPMWVITHICMEAMLGISLYSCFYLKLAKCYIVLIISHAISSTKLEKRQVLPRSGGTHTYTHVSKCKNDKLKFKNILLTLALVSLLCEMYCYIL